MSGQWRAQFDAVVAFANGGSLSTEGFRLDIPGDRIDDADLAALFVRHLGLLMVAEVRITNKTIIEEPHKGGRAVGGAPDGVTGRRLIELSHLVTDGMITLPGWPAPKITEWLSRERPASTTRRAPSSTWPGST